jgi:hypothetical protein
MTDVGTHHFVKGGQGKTVLVPQPSDDPADPLNWKLLWKISAITATSMVTFVQGLYVYSSESDHLWAPSRRCVLFLG